MDSVQDNDTLSSILLRFTGLVPAKAKKGFTLQGLVKVQERFNYVNLRLPHFPQLKDFRLVVRHGFYLKTFTNESNGFRDSWKIEDLLENLSSLLAASTENDKESLHIETVNPVIELSATNLFAEIAALYNPDFYVIKLNESSSLIQFSEFAVNDQHYLEVELPSLHIRAHSLPDCIKADELLSKCETLTAMVDQFQKCIEELQPFYESFIGIDELCYVIQPAKPSTKHNYRLFVLRERVFLKLVISDPFAPLGSMMVHIIGPTAEVETLRGIYSEGLKNWDNEMDIQRNLVRIFDLLYFPMPPEDDNNEEEQWICNICYSFRLESTEHGGCDVPIVSCDNPQCTLIFHDACLMEWFSTLSDNVSFLNVTFGNCPFCKAKLSTSFRELFGNKLSGVCN